MKYEVKDVVCDYGVFENDELKLICNSRRNALQIVDIMRSDIEYKILELQPVVHGHWVKNKPNPKIMQEFHKQKIGLAMGENSIYWTCSKCGFWGTPIYKYCSHCGARMDGEKHELTYLKQQQFLIKLTAKHLHKRKRQRQYMK